MPGSLNVSALVLRSSIYSDYDRMVTLLTEERGRVDAVARGCRRPKSELMNAAEPFVCGQYQLYFNHERYSVTQCKITDGFFGLRGDYERLCLGAKWLKKLEAVSVPEQPCPGLLQCALTALTYLTHSELDLALLDCMFNLKLSFFGGFAPSADRCAQCGRSANETALRFDASKGGCVCGFCAPNAKPLSEGARRILLKAPRTPYRAVEKLEGHPDLPEAAARIEETVEEALGATK